jgi:hypothetical protein
MSLPEYRYGQVTGLFPDLAVVSERGETPMVCCGYCSAHMACRTSRLGLSASMLEEAHEIRAAGGRPHNAGSKASELRAGAKDALGITLASIAIADIPDRLRNGFAVVASLQYRLLPAWLRVQANDFGHSATLYGWNEPDDQAGYFDPLWDQDARGAWAPWAQIAQALWANGNHSTTIVRLQPVAGDYVIFDEQVQSLKVGKVTGGTAFFNDWRMTSKRGQVGTGSIGVQIMGYRGEAYAIQVFTGQGWPDGVSRVTLVFVAKDAVSEIVNQPPPTAGASDEELLTARREGYDLAMSPFPPRP